MTKKGIQITCSGCGVYTFIEKPGNTRTYTLGDGTNTMLYNENQSESWVRVNTSFDLCPRCQKIHEKMLVNFYEECGKARDDGGRKND